MFQQAWSVIMRYTRRNNDVEGWHNRLIRGIHAKMNLEQLIEILSSGAKMVTIQVKTFEPRLDLTQGKRPFKLPLN